MKTIMTSTSNRGGDLVLQELWRIKDEQSAARGHDVHRLFAEARQRLKRSGLSAAGRNPKRRKA